MLWSTFYIESWKQTNARFSLRWGMNGFEEQEQSRPQFINHPRCEKIKSPITGQEITWFNPRMYLRRLALGACIMVVFMSLSICVALSLLYFAYFTKSENQDVLTVKRQYFWMGADEQVQCGPPHVAQGEEVFARWQMCATSSLVHLDPGFGDACLFAQILRRNVVPRNYKWHQRC